MRVVVLSGGTGSAKLLRGLKSELRRFTVIGNVGDNVWMHGLYICPDIDTAIYALAGILDSRKGWGLRSDTFSALRQMSQLGGETWFNLGDRDLALHLVRTEMLNRGATLTEVTGHVTRALGVEQRVLPATDGRVETHIITPRGELHLQEFWVKRRARPSVIAVKYLGARHASPTNQVVSAIERAKKIIICPANPVTSIMPILAISGMRALLASSHAEKIAVSPMIANHPFSGPAGKLMNALGHGTDSVAVAKIYSRYTDKFVIDQSDYPMKAKIEDLGLGCLVTNTAMNNHLHERKLARFLLEH